MGIFKLRILSQHGQSKVLPLRVPSDLGLQTESQLTFASLADPRKFLISLSSSSPEQKKIGFNREHIVNKTRIKIFGAESPKGCIPFLLTLKKRVCSFSLLIDTF